MAILPKQLFRGAASLSTTTLYSVPDNLSAVVTNILIVNSGAEAAEITLNLAGVAILSEVSLNPSETVAVDLKQVLSEFDIISAIGTSTDIKIHVSGVEIS